MGIQGNNKYILKYKKRGKSYKMVTVNRLKYRLKYLKNIYNISNFVVTCYLILFFGYI